MVDQQQAEVGRLPVIGCHLSVARGFAAMARDAASIDANTLAFFTRNPRGGRAKPLDPDDLAAFETASREAGIFRIVAHGSYTVNPCAAKEHVPISCSISIPVLMWDKVPSVESN